MEDAGEENILPTGVLLQLERGNHYRQLHSDTEDKLLCEINWESLQLSEESAERYPKLASELRKENNRTYEGYRSFIGGIPEEECFSDLLYAG